MNTLDRYIARQYLFNVLALLVVLFSFVVAIDVVINLHRFVRGTERFADGETLGALRRTLLTVLLIVDLWWPKLLQLYQFMIGLVLVGAMGFTVAQLVRNRETVAMLAGGLSLRRLARPVLIVAALMLGIKVLNQEFVLSNPVIMPLLTRDHGEAGKRRLDAFPVPLTRDGSGRLFMARSFDPDAGVMLGLWVWDRDPSGRATQRLYADSARYDSGGWDLENPSLTRLALAETGAGGRVIDAPAPPPERIITDLSPRTLLARRYAAFAQNLSWRQINQLLETPRLDRSLRESLVRQKYARISTVLSSFLALVITLRFFLTREPTNMLVQSLKCAPVGIVALVGGALGANFPVPGLPAGFATFLPVFVLLPIAIASVSSVRT